MIKNLLKTLGAIVFGALALFGVTAFFTGDRINYIIGTVFILIGGGLCWLCARRSPEEKARAACEKAAREKENRARAEARAADRIAAAEADRAAAVERARLATEKRREVEERKRQGAKTVRPTRKASCMGTLTEITDDVERITCPAWVVLDVETTGLHPDSDRVIEFAARRYRDGAIESEYSTLVFPDQRLPKKITELTGIRDKELLRAPRFGKIAPEVWAFIGDLPVVAHNAKFDAEFLVNECARAGIALDLNYIDTVRLARWTFPELENYKLSTLIRELGLLDHEQDHRAMSDVTATAKLYQRCREEQAFRVEVIRRSREKKAGKA